MKRTPFAFNTDAPLQQLPFATNLDLPARPFFFCFVFLFSSDFDFISISASISSIDPTLNKFLPSEIDSAHSAHPTLTAPRKKELVKNEAQRGGME